MKKRLLSLLLTTLILLGLFGCTPFDLGGAQATSGKNATTEALHEHLFENTTVTHTPCIVAGEETSTCACGETLIRPLPATGKHLYRNGICTGCGQNEIPLYAVSSLYDADGDGVTDVFYFSPGLTDRLENAVHVWAGDYDTDLSSTVSTTKAANIPHWYVANGQHIVYRVTVPETGLYEMVLHFRMKDGQARGTKYTVNGGTEHEQVFETSHSFEGTGYTQVRDPQTLSSYMYGVTVNLVEGENTIRIEQSSQASNNQHYRDFYFVKVGEYHLHAYENETVTTEASCAKAGERTSVCACGKLRTVVIPATGEHQYVNDVCTVCNRFNGETGILYYDFLYDQPGFAGGSVEFRPEVTDTYTFYWGDEQGKLASYTMLYSDTFYANTLAEVTIQSFTAIPAGATQLIVVGAGQKHTYSYSIPESRRFGGEALYSFGAISDSHQGNRYGNQSIPYNHFIDAVKDLDRMGASIIGMAGDFSYENQEFEYQLHAQAIKELYAYNSKLPIYTVSGNHESKYTGFSKDWFLKYSRDVVDYDTDMDPIFSDGNELDFVIELPDGSVMIYLNQQYYDYNTLTSRLLDDYQLTWLEKKLEQYQDVTVFLFFHTFIDGEAGDAQSSTGKEYGLPLIAGTVEYQKFSELFNKYQNVVYFSGHSHQSFDLQLMDPKTDGRTNTYTNIDNNNGTFATMVHIPSVAATRSGASLSDAKTRSEGYLVLVYEDCIVFQGYDFVNDQTFAYATYIIQK